MVSCTGKYDAIQAFLMRLLGHPVALCCGLHSPIPAKYLHIEQVICVGQCVRTVSLMILPGSMLKFLLACSACTSLGASLSCHAFCADLISVPAREFTQTLIIFLSPFPGALRDARWHTHTNSIRPRMMHPNPVKSINYASTAIHSHPDRETGSTSCCVCRLLSLSLASTVRRRTAYMPLD